MNKYTARFYKWIIVEKERIYSMVREIHFLCKDGENPLAIAFRRVEPVYQDAVWCEVESW